MLLVALMAVQLRMELIGTISCLAVQLYALALIGELAIEIHIVV